MPTAVERGSADCEPSGKAHRVTKATTRPGARVRRCPPPPGRAVPRPARSALVGLANRQAHPTFRRTGSGRRLMVATPLCGVQCGAGDDGSPEELSFPSDARARGLSIGMPDGDITLRSARRRRIGAGGVSLGPLFQPPSVAPVLPFLRATKRGGPYCGAHRLQGTPRGGCCSRLLLSYRITAAGLLG